MKTSRIITQDGSSVTTTISNGAIAIGGAGSLSTSGALSLDSASTLAISADGYVSIFSQDSMAIAVDQGNLTIGTSQGGSINLSSAVGVNVAATLNVNSASDGYAGIFQSTQGNGIVGIGGNNFSGQGYGVIGIGYLGRVGVVGQGGRGVEGMCTNGSVAGNAGVKGWGEGSSPGVLGIGDYEGVGIGVQGEASGIGVLGESTGSAVTHAGVYGQNLAGGYAVIAEGDQTSPIRSAFRIVPQDTDPTTAQNGDLYVNSTTNTLKICTNGAIPTWVGVGSGAVDGYAGVFDAITSTDDTGLISSGDGTGHGIIAVAGTNGHGLIVQGSLAANPVRAAFRIVPQNNLPTVGDVGDLFVYSLDRSLYICVASNPVTWQRVGLQT